MIEGNRSSAGEARATLARENPFRGKKLAILVVLLAVLGGAGWYVFGRGEEAHDNVPTTKVTKSAFVRRVTAEGNLRAVKATPVTAPSEGGNFGGPLKIAWIANDGSPVKKGDVVVKFDPSEQQKQLKAGRADLASANAKLAGEQIKSKTAVEARDSTADLASAELEQQRKFQSKDQQIFSRNTIIEAEIDEKLAGAKQDHAQKAKDIERKLSQSKANVIKVEQAKAQIAIAHASKALESTEVKAPHDGIIVLRRGWRGDVMKVGDQVWRGQKIAEIPLMDAMEVEVFVLEVDGSGLAEKQKVELVVESRPDITYKGSVKLVDKLAKPRQPGVPVQYFAVVVTLEKTDLAVMKPGQRVRAALVLDQSDALVVPRQAIVPKEGKNYVYKRGKHGFDSVEVELGAGTSGRVVVAKGLSPGDEIALRDPTRTADQAMGSGSEAASESKEKAAP